MEEFNSIYDLVKHLKSEEERTGEKYYYRGQLNKDWPIQSTISRANLDQKECEKTESLVKWLMNHNLLKLGRNDPLTEQKCYAIAQHYGYKTDFIDFTTSIDTAAFFATDGILENPEFDYGAIWRITEKEASMLEIFYEETLKLNSGKLPNGFMEMWEDLKFNPFISLDIENLSRINNQQGLFLWDFKELATRYFKGSQPNYIFKHKRKVYSSAFVNKSYIYPAPNALEIEIEKFNQKRINSNLNKKLFSELMKVVNFNLYVMEDHPSQTERYLPRNPWNENFSEPLSTHPRHAEKRESVEISVKTEYADILRSVIKTNRDSIESGKRIEINLSLECSNRNLNDMLLSDKINEVIQRLIYFNYSSDEILTVIDSFLIKYIDLRRTGEVEDFNDFVEIYRRGDYHFNHGYEEMIKIGLVEYSTEGSGTYAYVPIDRLRSIVESRAQEIRDNPEYLNNCEYDSLIDSWISLFMDLSLFPQKLFKFEEIRDLFLNYILPYQFIAYTDGSRIYTINDLKRIGPA